MPGATGYDRAREGDAVPVAERGGRAKGGLGALERRQRLSREQRLVDLQRRSRGKPNVGGHLVAGTHEDHVARDQLPGSHQADLTRPHHACDRCLQLPQRLERAGGLAFLERCNEGVQDDDGADGGGIHTLAEAGARDDRRCHEQQPHGLDQVMSEARELARGRRDRELVPAEPAGAACRLFVRQPGGAVDAECTRDVGEGLALRLGGRRDAGYVSGHLADHALDGVGSVVLA